MLGIAYFVQSVDKVIRVGAVDVNAQLEAVLGSRDGMELPSIWHFVPRMPHTIIVEAFRKGCR